MVRTRSKKGNSSQTFSHVNAKGQTRMVNVSEKVVTFRRAVAVGEVHLPKSIADAIKKNNVAKGNVLEIARIGAIQAAKKTSEIIPLCHPIPLSHISVDFKLDDKIVRIQAEVSAEFKTGVEMEALTAVAVSSLIIYDMCKGIDKGMVIGPIELIEKEGGKSGAYFKKVVRKKK
ncbi:MAG TPA: cyclic pyranopterin monophosphate synthase MoaC [Acidobacteriota bacterium]|nr:cyclic pyranopterin monophosphate synthase MoaC [Acidobacteriota bacterium]